MGYFTKEDVRENWLRKLKMYWDSTFVPRFHVQVGDIVEVDFGQNVGGEFSGRHLAICLEGSLPSQDKILVIPLTTKYITYNIHEDDLVNTMAFNGTQIKAGVVRGEAKWVSKLRCYRCSRILNDEKTYSLQMTKGHIELDADTLARWRML